MTQVDLIAVKSEGVRRIVEELDKQHGPQPAFNKEHFVNARKGATTRIRVIVDPEDHAEILGYVIWNYEVRAKEALITRLVLHPAVASEPETIAAVISAIAAYQKRPVAAQVPLMHVETCAMLGRGGMKPRASGDFVRFESGDAFLYDPKPIPPFKGVNRIKDAI